jgi:hypothetical protein
MPRPCNQIDRQSPENPVGQEWVVKGREQGRGAGGAANPTLFFLTQALPTASLLTLLAFGFLLLTFSL